MTTKGNILHSILYINIDKFILITPCTLDYTTLCIYYFTDNHSATFKWRLNMNNDVKCPYCSEPIKSDAIVCKHCKTVINKHKFEERNLKRCLSCTSILSEKDLKENSTICLVCTDNSLKEESPIYYFFYKYILTWPFAIIAFIVFAIATKDPDTGINCSNSGWVGSGSSERWSDTQYQQCMKNHRNKAAMMRLENQK